MSSRALLLPLALTVASLAAPAALAGCAAPDGRIEEIVPLTALEGGERRVALERFGAEFAEARRVKQDPKTLFAFARCELNGVAPSELVVMGRGPATCAGPEGAAPCGLWVLSRTEDGWLELLETVGAPVIAASRSGGWSDLIAGPGPSPTVYKFSQGAYAAETGEDELALDPLDEYGATLDGALQVVWFGVEDRMPPEAQAIFDWFWREVAVGEGGRLQALPDDYRAGLAPITTDSAPAIAIQGISTRDCGPAGCRHWIYRAGIGEGPPRLVTEFSGFDFNLAASGAFGHRDLVISALGGPQVLRFDGMGYRRSPLTRPLRPAEAAAEAAADAD